MSGTRGAVSSWGIAVVILIAAGFGAVAAAPSPPVVEGLWVRPSEVFPAQPVWGHAEGLRVGLWPMTGPRGLLRIYAPYLGHRDDRMINYIAVEPIVADGFHRGFSELEWSILDDEDGLRFWSADSPADPAPREPTSPARGVLSTDGNVEILTVYVFVEPFANGARVHVRLTFRSDRLYEVDIATFTQEGSASLAACVVTATMGNYARLRVLHVREGPVHAEDLWPGFDGLDFAPRVCFPLDDLLTTPQGGALLVAVPDEENPAAAEYAPKTFIGWKYTGEVATQTWRHENPPSELRGCVNGRTVYWASASPIPGGISFENFELVEPFDEGSEVWFGVVPGRYAPPQPLKQTADGE